MTRGRAARASSRITLEEAGGKVPVLAGAGSNDTRVAVEKTRRRGAALGVQGILSRRAVLQQADARGLLPPLHRRRRRQPVPVVVYNVPGRTGSNIDDKTLLRLAAHPNISAVKEASGNLGQIMEILRDRPPGFEVLSGDDAVTLPMMALGGEGVISVAANQVPRPDARPGRGLRPRGLRRGRGASTTAAAPHEPELRGVEPDPGEGLAGADGPVRRELPPAAVPARRTPRARRCARRCASWSCCLSAAPSGADRGLLRAARATSLGDEARAAFDALMAALESGARARGRAGPGRLARQRAG